MKTERLLSCPFCGYHKDKCDKPSFGRGYGATCISCPYCGAQGPDCRYEADAINEWNRRVRK